MQWRFSQRRVYAAERSTGAALLVAVILLLGACGAFPALHALVCPNANQPCDHCVVTKFVGGAVESPLAQAAVAVLFFCLAVLPCWNVSVCQVAPPFRLSPSRAPPFVSLLG
ncbi:MAG: hypothetical protein A2107_14485 [Verrucomicrobia bacterium GWF2_62_7]|nr:MAG: hypothetical protein A2107_14485 [Verrucomicrobia bacterium GWF2_62_7]